MARNQRGALDRFRFAASGSAEGAVDLLKASLFRSTEPVKDRRSPRGGPNRAIR
jgi:hypothetical protein